MSKLKMYPFLCNKGKKKLVKFHRDLYRQSLFDELNRQSPDLIKSIVSRKDYYYVDINASDMEEYFYLLNSLIYYERSR